MATASRPRASICALDRRLSARSRTRAPDQAGARHSVLDLGDRWSRNGWRRVHHGGFGATLRHAAQTRGGGRAARSWSASGGAVAGRRVRRRCTVDVLGRHPWAGAPTASGPSGSHLARTDLTLAAGPSVALATSLSAHRVQRAVPGRPGDSWRARRFAPWHWASSRSPVLRTHLAAARHGGPAPGSRGESRPATQHRPRRCRRRHRLPTRRRWRQGHGEHRQHRDLGRRQGARRPGGH